MGVDVGPGAGENLLPSAREPLAHSLTAAAAAAATCEPPPASDSASISARLLYCCGDSITISLLDDLPARPCMAGGGWLEEGMGGGHVLSYWSGPSRSGRLRLRLSAAGELP